MPDRVECHSGYAYGERPTAFFWEGTRLTVAEVLSTARTPEGKRFQVRTTDGQEFDLLYRLQMDDWLVTQR